jgi:excinuclease ABC subunit C
MRQPPRRGVLRSLVCFIDGTAVQDGYKRFPDPAVEGIDDYAMIREVILETVPARGRRGGVVPGRHPVDGGLGQLHAALSAFDEMNIRPPMVISLAKREEEIYISPAASRFASHVTIRPCASYSRSATRPIALHSTTTNSCGGRKPSTRT